MKLLLTSVDSIIDNRTGKPFPGIIAQLDDYLALNPDNNVVVISIRASRLGAIPKRFNPLKIPGKLRGSGDQLLNYIAEETDISITEVIVLGCKEHDMYTAAHLSSILLTAAYAHVNNPNDKIYKKGYGIPLNNVSSLGSFFESFYGIENPWYFKVSVDKITTMYALTNANTWNVDGTLAKLKDTFRACLKDDNDTYIIPFTSYFLVSTHRIIRELSEVDFWDIYPSSEMGKTNKDLLYFAKKAAHSFNREFNEGERILVRTKNTSRRHDRTKNKRIEIGCDEELESMVINKFYNGKIEGKSIAIVDDFTRIGTSCETARILLRLAGAAKIIFIAMGKFGFDKDYFKYKYQVPSGSSPYSKINFKKISYEIVEGTTNTKSNHEFLTSLSKII